MPVPLPARDTVTGNDLIVDVAVTVVAAVITTVHVPVPVHPPPDQPVKVELTNGAAVSTTLVPWLYVSVQSPPQLMPAGLLVTVLEPVPAAVTVST